METVTVAASRGSLLMSGTTLLILSVVVAAAVALVWFRHIRGRHQPEA